eukprot:s85_g16.t1
MEMVKISSSKGTSKVVLGVLSPIWGSQRRVHCGHNGALFKGMAVNGNEVVRPQAGRRGCLSGLITGHSANSIILSSS